MHRKEKLMVACSASGVAFFQHRPSRVALGPPLPLLVQADAPAGKDLHPVDGSDPSRVPARGDLRVDNAKRLP